MKKCLPLFVVALTLYPLADAVADNWPAWRGPRGDGISAEINLPVQWSREKNVVWRTALPGAGNSTPVVWGDRVFVTQSIAADNQRTLMCFDRADGKLLWQKGVGVDVEERTHETNPYASASPTTDGERVICWFGSAGVVAYDFDGNELWRTDLGKHSHVFGYGGSPVIHGDRVFLNFGPGEREFIVALSKSDGKEIWRHASPSPGKDDINGTWSTPIIAHVEGKAQLITALRDELAALDLATGEVIWSTSKSGGHAKASPAVGDGVVLMTAERIGNAIAVKLGGHGDIGNTERLLWMEQPAKKRIATGIIYQGHIYGVRSGGIADCVELRTGKTVWEERLRGAGANGAVWGSPVLAEGRIYTMNQSGDVFIYKASTQFETIAENSLGETTNSSIVISDGQLFIRTHQALWCIGGSSEM